MLSLLNDSIVFVNSMLWSWPLLIFIGGSAIVTTVYLRFAQFRLFVTAWKSLLFDKKEQSAGDMTPFQAFINSMSTSMGNGSIAGVATAIATGGPGAALWIFVFGLFSMSLRFAEVYLATSAGTMQRAKLLVGGPMVYLQKLPGGNYLAAAFAFFMLYLSLASGNAMQAHSIKLGIVNILSMWKKGSFTFLDTAFDITMLYTFIVACILLFFIVYVVMGGAQRVVKLSEKIVPFKVFAFMSVTIISLCYHYNTIIDSLILIVKAAFTPGAVTGALVGLSIQSALRFGIVRSVNATEAGLGSAGVLFGGTASQDPIKSAIMSIISVFISANIVCFGVALTIISSGVWNSGLTSLDLTIAAYSTIFGSLGAWIATILSLSFGIGVLVSYVYIARACWLFLTNGRGERVFNIVFCIITFLGALAHVDIIWNMIDIANGGLLIINILAILYYLPTIRTALDKAQVL